MPNTSLVADRCWEEGDTGEDTYDPPTAGWLAFLLPKKLSLGKVSYISRGGFASFGLLTCTDPPGSRRCRKSAFTRAQVLG